MRQNPFLPQQPHLAGILPRQSSIRITVAKTLRVTVLLGHVRHAERSLVSNLLLTSRPLHKASQDHASTLRVFNGTSSTKRALLDLLWIFRIFDIYAQSNSKNTL